MLINYVGEWFCHGILMNLHIFIQVSWTRFNYSWLNLVGMAYYPLENNASLGDLWWDATRPFFFIASQFSCEAGVSFFSLPLAQMIMLLSASPPFFGIHLQIIELFSCPRRHLLSNKLPHHSWYSHSDQSVLCCLLGEGT